MRKLINVFHWLAEYGAFLSMVGMVLAVTVQVVARFLLPSAPNWTEEVARVFFIYLVAFGVAMGIRDNAFVRLEILENYLTAKARRKLHLSIYIVICLFSISMLYYSYLFVMIGASERSPALEINMSIVFVSIVIMMLSLALLSLEQILMILYPQNKTL